MEEKGPIAAPPSYGPSKPELSPQAPETGTLEKTQRFFYQFWEMFLLGMGDTNNFLFNPIPSTFKTSIVDIETFTFSHLADALIQSDLQ